MKHKIIVGFVLFLISFRVFGKDNSDTTSVIKKEKALAIVPLITSSPLMGFGAGLSSSYLYKAGENAKSKSQLRVGGQYSSTKSYSIFAYNNMWLNQNRVRLLTGGTYSSINNEFTDNGEEVAYNINTIYFNQLQMFRVADHLYVGGPVMFKHQTFKPMNDAGESFIRDNGVENVTSGGFGLAASYDSRKNKYYPTNALFISTRMDFYPEWLGSDQYYSKAVLDARGYVDGFSKNDVLAMQVYGEYASFYTPDAGLPSVSGKTMLRGFPNGQLKARYMSGAQAEYRYTIGDSRFRLTGFAGVVNLAGGSYGDGIESRDDNGWYNAVGIGTRYRIQPFTGVDIRLDVVRTSLKEASIYLTLNQAF